MDHKKRTSAFDKYSNKIMHATYDTRIELSVYGVTWIFDRVSRVSVCKPMYFEKRIHAMKLEYIVLVLLTIELFALM